MIEIILQVVFSVVVLDLSLGIVRKNMIFLFLHQKKSTKQQLMQVKNPCGFEKSFQILDSSNNIRPPSGVTIRVPLVSPKIQFNINVKNTSRYAHTSSEISFMIELLKCSFPYRRSSRGHFHKVSYRSKFFEASIYIRSLESFL
jgi:hypothetical protein